MGLRHGELDCEVSLLFVPLLFPVPLFLPFLSPCCVPCHRTLPCAALPCTPL